MAVTGGDFARDRIDYGDAALRRADLPADPFVLFEGWLGEARGAGVSEPNGMALATVGVDGQPRCRIVLLKLCEAAALVFFTNLDSDKGRELRANPRAAATFWWPQPQNRQVRFTGRVELAGAAASDRYFHERPRGARIASAASPQSRVIADRAELERRVAELEAQVGDGVVPRPQHWGGYRLLADEVEFWQGRNDRMHDRFRYARTGAAWRIERLAP